MPLRRKAAGSTNTPSSPAPPGRRQANCSLMCITFQDFQGEFLVFKDEYAPDRLYFFRALHGIRPPAAACFPQSTEVPRRKSLAAGCRYSRLDRRCCSSRLGFRCSYRAPRMAVNRRDALVVLSERLHIRLRISSGISYPSHHNGLRVLRSFS